MYTEPTVEGKNKIANAILSSPYLSGGKNPVTDINFLEINTGTDAAPVMELVMEVEYLDPRKNRSGDTFSAASSLKTKKILQLHWRSRT